ncbi:hypothetical protein GGX14DRAFT_478809 [Mycena pura]|uniref:Uncharacterized protein n=1 Tax=Mycena pura TaxID=153505 RepID=A0AAD6UYZ5_9AGAR|nr:hypothetical protein GGX14DRAFT_478809 [Mycena pura]
MSFQHFRLGEVPPLPAHLVGHASAPGPTVQQFQTSHMNNTFPTNNSPVGQTKMTKAPYGSGDDDAYTLVFPNLAAFHEWRAKEEETQMVEFVKVLRDTHGSKAVPPRFKDHTKLVCARHSRSGRKKYVKKHPERVRKVPSRKLDGVGCSASISYKTYYDSDEVRACYISQHSHEIGIANLPYTRRGRKAAVQQETERKSKQPRLSHRSSASSASTEQPTEQLSNAISMIAPLPTAQTMFPPQPALPPHFQLPQQTQSAASTSHSHDRWENMATLFQAVRGHARAFEYPTASVAALETVLIRLYLESPVTMGSQPILQNGGAAPDTNIQPNLGEDGSASGHASEDDGT